MMVAMSGSERPAETTGHTGTGARLVAAAGVPLHAVAARAADSPGAVVGPRGLR